MLEKSLMGFFSVSLPAQLRKQGHKKGDNFSKSHRLYVP